MEHEQSSEHRGPAARRINGCDLSARHTLVLAVLAENGRQSTLHELSLAVAARTLDCQTGTVPQAVLRRYYTELGSTLLAELEEKRLIKYCPEKGTVRLTAPDVAPL